LRAENCEAELRAPRRAPLHSFRLEQEEVDAPRELLEHPRRAVAARHVLRVEDAGVEQRSVGHRDDLLLAVHRLERRVRAREPDGVGVGLQHVEAEVDRHPRRVVLAQVVEVEGERPVLADADAVVLRLARVDPRRPHAREVRVAGAQRGARRLRVADEEDVVEPQRAQLFDCRGRRRGSLAWVQGARAPGHAARRTLRRA